MMLRSAPGAEPLGFFASGATQHVFTATDEADVVYKIPAVFPVLRPGAFSLASFHPVRPWKARLWAAARSVTPRRMQEIGSPLLKRYVTHCNRRRFGRMIGVLRYLLSCDRALGVLPFAPVDFASALLYTPEGVRRYSGPMLIQQRAEAFLTQPGTERIDTAAIIRIQHRLWEVGVGLDDRDTVVGPHNWAIFANRTYLGDTGSLTRDREHVRAMLHPSALDHTCERVLRRCSSEESRCLARQHLGLVRQHITLEEFDERWASAHHS